MLLYISGSYPENPEGIAAGAKVLLDAMVEAAGKEKFVLLTTNAPIITEHIQESSLVDYELMDNWKLSSANKKRFYHLLDKYPIDVIHMEYPGDLYGKTFLASFIPLLVKKYNKNGYSPRSIVTFFRQKENALLNAPTPTPVRPAINSHNAQVFKL